METWSSHLFQNYVSWILGIMHPMMFLKAGGKGCEITKQNIKGLLLYCRTRKRIADVKKQASQKCQTCESTNEQATRIHEQSIWKSRFNKLSLKMQPLTTLDHKPDFFSLSHTCLLKTIHYLRTLVN